VLVNVTDGHFESIGSVPGFDYDRVSGDDRPTNLCLLSDVDVVILNKFVRARIPVRIWIRTDRFSLYAEPS